MASFREQNGCEVERNGDGDEFGIFFFLKKKIHGSFF